MTDEQRKQIEGEAKILHPLHDPNSLSMRYEYMKGAEFGLSLSDNRVKELDAELNIVHECLTDLYEHQYNNQSERVKRIKECLSKIELLTPTDNGMKTFEECNFCGKEYLSNSDDGVCPKCANDIQNALKGASKEYINQLIKDCNDKERKS